MKRPRVKVCGITTLEDARFCAGAGVDYLGFIFYRKSPRYIPPTTVRAIRQWLHGPKLVGVFVDEDPETINQIAEEADLDLVQLHGSESPAQCRRVQVPVIKAHRVRVDSVPDCMHGRLTSFDGAVAWHLLDTWHPVLRGGTGESFDWKTAAQLARNHQIMLSGGLGPHNVAEAIESARPWAIDLSSGVETAPGRKDFDQVTALFDVLDA